MKTMKTYEHLRRTLTTNTYENLLRTLLTHETNHNTQTHKHTNTQTHKHYNTNYELTNIQIQTTIQHQTLPAVHRCRPAAQVPSNKLLSPGLRPDNPKRPHRRRVEGHACRARVARASAVPPPDVPRARPRRPRRRGDVQPSGADDPRGVERAAAGPRRQHTHQGGRQDVGL